MFIAIMASNEVVRSPVTLAWSFYYSKMITDEAVILLASDTIIAGLKCMGPTFKLTTSKSMAFMEFIEFVLTSSKVLDTAEESYTNCKADAVVTALTHDAQIFNCMFALRKRFEIDLGGLTTYKVSFEEWSSEVDVQSTNVKWMRAFRKEHYVVLGNSDEELDHTWYTKLTLAYIRVYKKFGPLYELVHKKLHSVIEKISEKGIEVGSPEKDENIEEVTVTERP